MIKDSIQQNENTTILNCKSDFAVSLSFELQVRESDKKLLITAPAVYRPLPDIET